MTNDFALRLRLEACDAALAESEARFRNVIDRNADAIVVVGLDGVVQYANDMADRLFGVEPGQLNGTPFGFPLIAGDTAVVDLIVHGAARVAEMRLVASTWNGSPVHLASLRDVTDLETLRRERTAQLAETMAAARLREVFSQAPVAIAVLRGKEHRYESANARYCQLIGNRNVVGQPIRDALPELAGQGIFELLDQVYSTGVPYVGTDVRMLMRRGDDGPEEGFFTFVYHPLREADGAVSGVAVVATDVTVSVRARIELEAINQQLHRQATQLEQQATELEAQFEEAQTLADQLEYSNQRLEKAIVAAEAARADAEKANRAKSDFLATMSHELRTPLNAVGGYADLLLAGIRGPVTEAQSSDLERIKRNQRHLLSVINDILNFAKVEAGRVRFELRHVSMNAALGELESLVAPLLLQKQIAYEYYCCDPEYTAYVDPERLQQILLNLLSNAVKFTPSRGRITVQCAATKDAMRVSVRDSGVGIPAEKLQQIFEPFVQLERGQGPALGGTGLGLAISRDLARAMGGELTAESKLDEGSTFTLTLPRRAPED
ncbi:MAG: sensor protein [Gemmatimonadetes bacterium]|nr:sensor protein [Gemmatimonadota bacterium]